MAKRLHFRQVTEEQWRQLHDQYGSVYLILDSDNDRVKVGHSSDPWKRLRQLQTGSSAKLSLIGVIAGTVAIEKRLHREFRAMNHHLEWFSGGRDATKWLNAQTGNMPMCRVFAQLETAEEFEVWWEWDHEHKVHFKHVYDRGQQKWIGPLMYGGKPNARPGWSSRSVEIGAT